MSGWSTGGFAKDPALEEEFSARGGHGQHVALGYAAPRQRAHRERAGAADVTRWVCESEARGCQA